MPVFEVKLWANGKRTRLYLQESSNCLEHTEKENFHFPIAPHTWSWSFHTQIYANMSNNSKTVDF